MKKLLLLFLTFNSSFLTLYAQRWDTLGGGLKHIGVLSLIVYNGNLIAGGGFDTAGGQPAYNIAQWNGVSWSNPFGSGIWGVSDICTRAYTMTLYNGNLIVGGAFSSVGGKSATNIAEWNGSAWSNPFGAGLGAIWCGIGNDYAATSIVYKGKLIVGGLFSTAGGVPVNNIAQWDGSKWDSLGSGVTGGKLSVETLDTFQGNLIAGGQFDTAGGQPAEHIAEWNGSSWGPLGSGCNNPVLPDPGVYSLTVYKGNLIAGGEFDIAGGQPAEHIAEWNGSSWSTFGSGANGDVWALNVYKGNLVASGPFTIIAGDSVNEIGVWNGSTWSALGTSKGPPWGGGGQALTEYNKLLIDGGQFDVAGGIYVNEIASWCDSCPPLAVPQLGIKNYEVRIYPNPNDGKFTLTLTAHEYAPYIHVPGGEGATVEIYNMLGKRVFMSSFGGGVQRTEEVNLHDTPNGIYLYRVVTETGSLAGEGKLMIVR